MKNAFLYCFLIATTCFIASCDENPVDQNNLSKYYKVTGTVWDHCNNNSPNPKTNVPVVIDNDTSITNTAGEFSFDKVNSGSHIISVSLTGFEHYIDTVSVGSNTVIDIHISGIKEDYFPIQVNTQKRFEYHYGSGGGLFWVSDSGEAIWNIYSLIQEEDKLIYNVEETLIYVRTTQNGGTFPPDTVVTTFKFIEDESHIITIQSSIWDGIYFNRYLDPREGDIIQFNFLERKIYLKRNVGLYKLSEESMLYLSGTTYELIE
jgi:hypothetical protein